MAPTTTAPSTSGTASFEILTHQADIWTDKILPFLGPGHFIFVAGVNRRMKELYNEYFTTLSKIDIPRVKKRGLSGASCHSTPAIALHTFYRNTFSSTSCADFWEANNGPQSLIDANQEVCELVAKAGHLTVMKWACEKGYQWCRESTCAAAAEGGNLEVLKWLREKECPWTRGTCMQAARGGHLEVLKWAHENGCPWNEWVCCYAARGGQLEALKWLRENGCPWDAMTCIEAAREGHLEVLKWARENGCPWNKWVCTYASKGGHLQVLRWARENGCRWDERT